MKTIAKYILIIILPMGIFGCGELESVDYAEINPSIFPKTEEDLQALVMSCYYPLRGSWWDGINHNSERGQMFVNDCCTEILTGKFGIQKMCSELSFTEMNNEITWFYYIRPGGEYSDGFSNKISRCTLVIDAIENSDLNADLKNK